MHKLISHALIPNSKVNGPGSRTTLWTQGCTKACPGCFNPETWTKKGTEENIEDVYNSIKNYIDNLCILYKSRCAIKCSLGVSETIFELSLLPPKDFIMI